MGENTLNRRIRKLAGLDPREPVYRAMQLRAERDRSRGTGTRSIATAGYTASMAVNSGNPSIYSNEFSFITELTKSGILIASIPYQAHDFSAPGAELLESFDVALKKITEKIDVSGCTGLVFDLNSRSLNSTLVNRLLEFSDRNVDIAFCQNSLTKIDGYELHGSAYEACEEIKAQDANLLPKDFESEYLTRPFTVPNRHGDTVFMAFKKIDFSSLKNLQLDELRGDFLKVVKNIGYKKRNILFVVNSDVRHEVFKLLQEFAISVESNNGNFIACSNAGILVFNKLENLDISAEIGKNKSLVLLNQTRNYPQIKSNHTWEFFKKPKWIPEIGGYILKPRDPKSLENLSGLNGSDELFLDLAQIEEKPKVKVVLDIGGVGLNDLSVRFIENQLHLPVKRAGGKAVIVSSNENTRRYLSGLRSGLNVCGSLTRGKDYIKYHLLPKDGEKDWSHIETPRLLDVSTGIVYLKPRVGSSFLGAVKELNTLPNSSVRAAILDLGAGSFTKNASAIGFLVGNFSKAGKPFVILSKDEGTVTSISEVNSDASFSGDFINAQMKLLGSLSRVSSLWDSISLATSYKYRPSIIVKFDPEKIDDFKTNQILLEDLSFVLKNIASLTNNSQYYGILLELKDAVLPTQLESVFYSLESSLVDRKLIIQSSHRQTNKSLSGYLRVFSSTGDALYAF